MCELVSATELNCQLNTKTLLSLLIGSLVELQNMQFYF